MKGSEQKMLGEIRKMCRKDLELLKGEIPRDGIWAYAILEGTPYQCALRVLPAELGKGEYAVWVDVFLTIYDPIYSNTLYKGTPEQVKTWLREDHSGEICSCMYRLHHLASQGL